MKSIGEIMAIGRNFEETLQKAIRMVNSDFTEYFSHKSKAEIMEEIAAPTDKRIFAIFEAIRRQISLKEISGLSGINQWYLAKIKNIVELEERIKAFKLENFPAELLRLAKQKGFKTMAV